MNKCLIENCPESANILTNIGLVCGIHTNMFPEKISGQEIKKHCLICKSEECFHVKEGKLTSDGKPETLGVNVSEEVGTEDKTI